jgi:hypothetical protein
MIVEKSAAVDHIILHHTPHCWIAEFRGAVGRELAAIAGVDTLPTGFNGHVPGTVVCQAIAILNPDAEVILADAATEPRPLVATGAPAHAFSQVLHDAQASPSSPKSQTSDPLSLAAEIVRKYLPAKPAEAPKPAPVADVDPGANAHRATIARARKIRHSLGLIVACSFLKERGWSVEAAHRALVQAEPRGKPENC